MADASGALLVRVGAAAFGLFAVGFAALAWLIGPPEGGPEGYAIAPAALGPDGTWQVTLDARDGDAWVPYSLELGRVVPDGAAADLLVRRRELRAPRGAARVDAPLRDATPPSERPLEDFGRWYDYDYLTHLLTPQDATYAVGLAEGAALVQIVSYYCLPEGSGCLTLRYRP